VTDHRDPIEAWLSADVEPLPPRPGTFERVRRRARRRKAVRTISAAGGAAVLVAAVVVTLPQVAGLLPGRSNANNVNSATAPPGTRSASRSAIASPTSTESTPPRRGQALWSASSGPQPPANFEPASVTFVGPRTGAVLGQGGKACARGLCTAIAGTRDYGSNWSAMAAPATEAPNGSSGVSQIRFLNVRDGWAYGPALYATHNGGATWRPDSALPGRVIDLGAVGDRVFALSASCAGQGRAFASGCTSFALYSASVGSDRWQPVIGASGQGAVRPGSLQLTASTGYLLAGHRIYSGPVTPGSWHAATGAPGAPGAVQPPCLRLTSQGLALIAPSGSNGSNLYLACGPPGVGSQASGAPSLRLYLSADAGQSWQPRGAVNARGSATSLAASSAGVVVLATTSGLWWSPDASTWQRASLGGSSPAGGFVFVDMTSTQLGVAVPADRALHEVFTTQDGSMTWQPHVIQ
jgi:hypothetical protein